jgi:hypothetical protein
MVHDYRHRYTHTGRNKSITVLSPIKFSQRQSKIVAKHINTMRYANMNIRLLKPMWATRRHVTVQKNTKRNTNQTNTMRYTNMNIRLLKPMWATRWHVTVQKNTKRKTNQKTTYKPCWILYFANTWYLRRKLIHINWPQNLAEEKRNTNHSNNNKIPLRPPPQLPRAWRPDSINKESASKSTKPQQIRPQIINPIR